MSLELSLLVILIEEMQPLLTSHRMAVLSTEPDKIWVQSGDQQRSYTSSMCPRRIFSTVQFSWFSASLSLLENMSGISDFGFNTQSIITASTKLKDNTITNFIYNISL